MTADASAPQTVRRKRPESGRPRAGIPIRSPADQPGSSLRVAGSPGGDCYQGEQHEFHRA